MSRIASILARMAVKPATPDHELEELRARAWREQRVLVLKPEDVSDEWLRQAMVNEAERRYGPAARPMKVRR